MSKVIWQALDFYDYDESEPNDVRGEYEHRIEAVEHANRRGGYIRSVTYSDAVPITEEEIKATKAYLAVKSEADKKVLQASEAYAAAQAESKKLYEKFVSGELTE